MRTPGAERRDKRNEVVPRSSRAGPVSASKLASSHGLWGSFFSYLLGGEGVKPRISVTRHDRAVNYRCNELSGAGDVLTPAGLAVKLIRRTPEKYVIRGLCAGVGARARFG